MNSKSCAQPNWVWSLWINNHLAYCSPSKIPSENGANEKCTALRENGMACVSRWNAAIVKISNEFSWCVWRFLAQRTWNKTHTNTKIRKNFSLSSFRVRIVRSLEKLWCVRWIYLCAASMSFGNAALLQISRAFYILVHNFIITPLDANLQRNWLNCAREAPKRVHRDDRMHSTMSNEVGVCGARVRSMHTHLVALFRHLVNKRASGNQRRTKETNGCC